jgi:ABC-type Mn2+/Zn2+ transport system ATPase subunit
MSDAARGGFRAPAAEGRGSACGSLGLVTLLSVGARRTTASTGARGVVTQVEGLRKRYRRGPVVLAGVDLTLEAGAPVVLGGGNGSGKSTLLRIVAGAAAPTAGRVRGRPRVVGYLPDRFPALLRLPVDVYLRHLAAIRGVPVNDGLLAALGFTGSRTDAMARLSKGNAQKVGLTQALGCGAGLVVLDEPWAGLDTEAADTLDALLVDRARATAVLVTDHTGRADKLPGVRRFALVQGRVHPRADAGGRGARTGETPAALPGGGVSAVTPAAVGGGRRSTTPDGAVADAASDDGKSAAVRGDGESHEVVGTEGGLLQVVLRSSDPVGLRERLGWPAAVDGNRLILRVDADRSDALLLAALRCGGFVEFVGPG